MISLGEAKTRLARFAASDDLEARINAAVEILINSANSTTSKARVAFNVTNGKLTLPREYSAVLGLCIDDAAGYFIRNKWYEVLPAGEGVLDNVTDPLDCGDGWVCHTDIADVSESGGQLEVRSSMSETAGTKITLMGLDQNGDEIRTDADSDGDLTLGEKVEIKSSSYAASASTFTALTGVVKPVTNGTVSIYLLVSGNYTLLATYAPDETSIGYRRYRIPALTDSDGTDEARTVVALCQRRPVYLTDDNAILPGVTSWEGLRLMMQSLQLEENSDYERAEALRQKAIRAVSQEFNRQNPTAQMPPPVQFFGRGPRSFY